ncbi:MAG TPA: hypothetical protein VJ526_13630, partial [Beijerinckiaceae bacterium]|nr:hypothetical protein [Beijerinckiaceae bacterium]
MFTGTEGSSRLPQARPERYTKRSRTATRDCRADKQAMGRRLRQADGDPLLHRGVVLVGRRERRGGGLCRDLSLGEPP